jgi:hypothetical protein
MISDPKPRPRGTEVWGVERTSAVQKTNKMIHVRARAACTHATTYLQTSFRPAGVLCIQIFFVLVQSFVVLRLAPCVLRLHASFRRRRCRRRRHRRCRRRCCTTYTSPHAFFLLVTLALPYLSVATVPITVTKHATQTRTGAPIPIPIPDPCLLVSDICTHARTHTQPPPQTPYYATVIMQMRTYLFLVCGRNLRTWKINPNERYFAAFPHFSAHAKRKPKLNNRRRRRASWRHRPGMTRWI